MNRILASALVTAVLASGCAQEEGLIVDIVLAGDVTQEVKLLDLWVGVQSPDDPLGLVYNRRPATDGSLDQLDTGGVFPYRVLLIPEAEPQSLLIGARGFDADGGSPVALGVLQQPVDLVAGELRAVELVLHPVTQLPSPGSDCLGGSSTGPHIVLAEDKDQDCYAPGTNPTDDCDDEDRGVHPNRYDDCDDPRNNDCDGKYNEDSDGDGDGWTAECGSVFAQGCSGGDCLTDCEDDNAEVHPEHEDTCATAGTDDDCDGDYNEDDDVDGDGWTSSCGPTTSNSCGLAADSCASDCFDGYSDANPGADEVLGNGKDDNCSNPCEDDADGDGVTVALRQDSSSAATGWVDWLGQGVCIQTDAADCSEDNNRSGGISHPNALEICDGVDNDCSSDASAGGRPRLPCFVSPSDGVCVVGTRMCSEDPASGNHGWGCAVPVDPMPQVLADGELCQLYAQVAQTPWPEEELWHRSVTKNVTCTVSILEGTDAQADGKPCATLPQYPLASLGLEPAAVAWATSGHLDGDPGTAIVDLGPWSVSLLDSTSVPSAFLDGAGASLAAMPRTKLPDGSPVQVPQSVFIPLFKYEESNVGATLVLVELKIEVVSSCDSAQAMRCEVAN